jgi:hypothetical protein
MPTPYDPTAAVDRPRRAGWRALAAVALGSIGVVVAALAVGGPGPAVGGPPAGTWYTVGDDGGETSFADPGWSDISTGNPADIYPLQYKMGSDSRVYLRGGIGGGGVVTARWPGDGGGPWSSPIFTLPCGYRPEHTAVLSAAVNDAFGRNGYSGMVGVAADGTVRVASWDVPTFEDGADVVWDIIVNPIGDFEADNDEVCPEPTTTTTTTEEPTTTTEAP